MSIDDNDLLQNKFRKGSSNLVTAKLTLPYKSLMNTGSSKPTTVVDL